MKKSRHLNTDAIHAGEHPEWFNMATMGDISLSTSFVIENTKQLLDGSFKYIYTRHLNPTRDCLQQKLAAMDGSEAAIALSSGMAAISVALLSVLKPGDTLICQKIVYGGTFDFVTKVLPRFAINTIFVENDKLYDLSWAPKEAKAVFIETPINPTIGLIDIKQVAQQAKSKGIISIMDNSFATMVLQKPSTMGVDLVVYSATKFLGGHSDILAGVITGKKDLVCACDTLMSQIGCPLDPFHCYLLSRSLKTLEIRVLRAQSNAMEIARFLANHPKVTRVFYPGLWNAADRELALKQMKGWGAMLTFEVSGGLEGASVVFDNLNLVIRAGSLGGIETTISIPVLMSHHHLNEDELKERDITPGMLRLSVGIEDSGDLESDLKQALDKVP